MEWKNEGHYNEYLKMKKMKFYDLISISPLAEQLKKSPNCFRMHSMAPTGPDTQIEIVKREE